MSKKGEFLKDEDIEVVEAEIVEIIEVETRIETKKKYTELRVFIDIEKENIHFDFGVPLNMISVFGDLTNFIPEDKIKKIGKEGFDFRGYDFKKLIRDIENGDLRNPIIYKSDSNNDEGVQIKIYVN